MKFSLLLLTMVIAVTANAKSNDYICASKLLGAGTVSVDMTSGSIEQFSFPGSSTMITSPTPVKACGIEAQFAKMKGLDQNILLLPETTEQIGKINLKLVIGEVCTVIDNVSCSLAN